jgi:hypothetical protein
MTRAVSERVAVLEADPLFKAAPAFDSMGDLGGLSLVILAAVGFDCLATDLDEELLATFCFQNGFDMPTVYDSAAGVSGRVIGVGDGAGFEGF